MSLCTSIAHYVFYSYPTQSWISASNRHFQGKLSTEFSVFHSPHYILQFLLLLFLWCYIYISKHSKESPKCFYDFDIKASKKCQINSHSLKLHMIKSHKTIKNSQRNTRNFSLVTLSFWACLFIVAFFEDDDVSFNNLGAKFLEYFKNSTIPLKSSWKIMKFDTQHEYV